MSYIDYSFTCTTYDIRHSIYAFLPSFAILLSTYSFPFFLMALLNKKTAVRPPFTCVFTKWVVCILLFVSAVTALVGVYQTHVMTSSDGAVVFQFGTTSCSLALVAFVLAVLGWVKSLHCCMAGSCTK